PHLDLLLRGYQMLHEAVVRLQVLTDIHLAYRAVGMLGTAISQEEEKELSHKQSWQSAMGLQADCLDERQVKQIEPAIDGPVRLGVWWPCVSRVNTVSLIQAYQALLERGGAVLHTGLPVRRFLLKENRLMGVETDEGRVRADGVVNCAGPWAPFDKGLPFEIQTFPVKGQIVQLATDKPLVRSIVKFGKTYLVQRDSRTLLVGTTVASLAAVGAIVAAFAGILADPLQRSFGMHRRRMNRMLDTIEKNFRGEGPAAFSPRDHYVARLVDAVDVVRIAHRIATGS
uniref:NAD(P)/FAD-dependent oxidoreductase n=1 Tax=Thalassobaculum salexigens TaxID=455360 RepID=UPI00248E90B9